MKLNERGQCPACKRKPLIYKSDWKLCCLRCGRYYDPITEEQMENYQWKRNADGEWVEDYDESRRSPRPPYPRPPWPEKWERPRVVPYVERTHEEEMARPVVGVAKVGTSRWFWVYWPTHRPCYDGEPPERHGYSDTYGDAVKSVGGMENLSWHGRYSPGAHWALNWRGIFAAQKRKPNLNAKPDAKVIEFLYHRDSMAHCSGNLFKYGDDDSAFHKHRILRKTRKKVFVEADCTGSIDNSGGVFRVKARALNRADLETRGFAPVISYYSSYDPEYGPPDDRDWGEFYVVPPEPEEREVQECFAFLGLKPPVTIAEVKRAFRKLSKKYHPDHGGDAAAFRNLHEQFEKAMELAEAGESN